MGLTPGPGRTIAETLIRHWCRTNLPQFDGVIGNLRPHAGDDHQWDFAAGRRDNSFRSGLATIDQNNRVRVEWAEVPS
ncbi:MAG TPA: hypothetical protein VGN32_03825 [Ktedonobacterales bacterium]|jgi:hypothetical protein|nr:hypothetical protein [Ktedonobacterales bacterium]